MPFYKAVITRVTRDSQKKTVSQRKGLQSPDFWINPRYIELTIIRETKIVLI